MKKTLKKLYLIMGLPGDGKTTLANDIKDADLVIAQDDSDGLYVNGIFQPMELKAAIAWCFNTVENWMAQSVVDKIVVHNTFTRQIYRNNYLELARKYGYAVHLVTSNGIFLPDGTRTENEHGVSDSTLVKMRQEWEPVNPKERLGISLMELNEELSNLTFPTAILFDMDGTVKQTKSGKEFPESPNDLILTEQFFFWMKNCLDELQGIEIFLISNQMGMEQDRKDLNFLTAEYEALEREIQSKFPDTYQYFFTKIYFAPSRDKYDCLTGKWNTSDWKAEIKATKLDLFANKPNIGIYQHFWNWHQDLIQQGQVWIVGNAHTDDSPTDWQFAKNCRFWDRDTDIRYIPIELLQTAWKLIDL